MKKIIVLFLILLSYSGILFAQENDNDLTFVESANSYISNSSVKKVDIPYKNHTNCLWLEFYSFTASARPGFLYAVIYVADADHNIYRIIGSGEIDYNGRPTAGAFGFSYRDNEYVDLNDRRAAKYFDESNIKSLKDRIQVAKKIYIKKIQ